MEKYITITVDSYEKSVDVRLWFAREYWYKCYWCRTAPIGDYICVFYTLNDTELARGELFTEQDIARIMLTWL